MVNRKHMNLDPIVAVTTWCAQEYPYAAYRSHTAMFVLANIINTSYQKLPFGSGDYPDKLLFHQALN